MRKINEIIIHCSATPEGKDYTVADIKKWHLQRGFNDIGYHYVIYRDGTYHRGRQDDVIGAHCTGHNANSIGICYIGGLTSDGKKSKDTRTEAQKKTLITLIRTMKARYPGAKVVPHYKYAAKDCPCFDAEAEYKNI
jgi:N-acetylmuramoyl-L-alanine amidase